MDNSNFKIILEGKETSNVLSIVEQQYLKNENIPEHRHTKESHFVEVVEGKFVFQIKNKKHTLVKGDSILIKKNIWHSFKGILDKNILKITFYPAGLEQLLKVTYDLEQESADYLNLYKTYGIEFR